MVMPGNVLYMLQNEYMNSLESDIMIPDVVSQLSSSSFSNFVKTSLAFLKWMR